MGLGAWRCRDMENMKIWRSGGALEEVMNVMEVVIGEVLNVTQVVLNVIEVMPKLV